MINQQQFNRVKEDQEKEDQGSDGAITKNDVLEFAENHVSRNECKTEQNSMYQIPSTNIASQNKMKVIPQSRTIDKLSDDDNEDANYEEGQHKVKSSLSIKNDILNEKQETLMRNTTSGSGPGFY